MVPKKSLFPWLFVLPTLVLVANNMYFSANLWSWFSVQNQISMFEGSHQDSRILERPLELPGDNTPTIVLLRSIGNALPPRHDPQQAIKNLKFTLTYEPDYPNVYKHWVLNRLVDPEIELQLIELLQAHGANYSRIPFILEDYAKIPYNFEFWDEPDVIHTMKFHNREMWETDIELIDECITNDKNLYATNQNGARNEMLDIGINEYEDADWILPWDGNCFVHPNGIENLFWQLHNFIEVGPKQKYFYTPMSRATANDEVLDPEYDPETNEEPQLVFHKSAQARFHSSLRYGRRNKIEMIQRLQIPGPWDNWAPLEEWEEEHLGPFHEPVKDLWSPAPTAGWVTRLASGRDDLEVKGSNVARWKARIEGRQNLLLGLDERAAVEVYNYNSDTLLFYNEAALQRDRDLYQKKTENSHIQLVVDELLNLAQSSQTSGPWSVTDKPEDSVAPSNDPHDFHPTPYSWPDRNEDSNSSPDEDSDTDMVESYSCDRTRLLAMTHNTTVLALAYYMTGEEDYGWVAARNIQHWFLDPDTRMNPDMEYAPTGTQSGVIEMKDLHFLLDAVRIVEKGGFLTEEEMTSLRDWFREYLQWLENSDQGMEEYTEADHHGTFYDIQYVAVAAFVNDTTRMLRCLDGSVSRLLQQVEPDGSMPEEMEYYQCEHYQMFTLSGWATLARMGQAVGRELWKAYPDENGDSALCRAATFSIPFFSDREICDDESPTENVERWWPLLLEAQHHCPSLSGKDTHWPEWFPEDAKHPPSTAYEMPSMYNAQDGISPFWNLGMPHAMQQHDTTESDRPENAPVELA